MHSRYGPPFRSSAKSALHRRASTVTVTHPSRLSATGPTDHRPGGTLTHKVVAPLQGAPTPDPGLIQQSPDKIQQRKSLDFLRRIEPYQGVTPTPLWALGLFISAPL